jgi:hypothetical protein
VIAINWLGAAYFEGWGVAVDVPRAVSLYTLAAAHGQKNAQRNLGNCYVRGSGVPVDALIGHRLIKAAEAQKLSSSPATTDDSDDSSPPHHDHDVDQNDNNNNDNDNDENRDPIGDSDDTRPNDGTDNKQSLNNSNDIKSNDNNNDNDQPNNTDNGDDSDIDVSIVSAVIASSLATSSFVSTTPTSRDDTITSATTPQSSFIRIYEGGPQHPTNDARANDAPSDTNNSSSSTH